VDRGDQLEVYKDEAADGAPIVAAGLPSVEVVDAPVRQRRFRRAGRAATSEQGQLPASDVPPRYAPAPRDHHPTRQP
jgi:hypothetical protein